MIGYRSPFRVSFVGGGSDLKDFYEKSEGSVVSLPVDKYIYIIANKFFYNKIQLKYSKTELVSDIKYIKHSIFKKVLEKYKVGSIDINSISDIPSKTGLASSSAFTCALVATIRDYLSLKIENYEIAKEACDIEINKLKNPIGKQDQFGSAIGGIKKIIFKVDKSVEIKKIKLEKKYYKKLEESICLYYISSNKNLNSILFDVKKNLVNKKEKFCKMIEMTQLVDPFINSLRKGDIKEAGNILNINWELKKSLSNKITNYKINEIYKAGIKNGAYGGKLLGSGGGGFILFLCNKNTQKQLNQSLETLKRISVKIDEKGLVRFI